MLEAFDVVDELYCDLEVAEDVEVLMMGSDGHTKAQPVVWRRTERTFKSAYCSMGHDLSALSNPSLSALINKLMLWLLEEGR
jgi:type 1 glutamine amidotransferase